MRDDVVPEYTSHKCSFTAYQHLKFSNREKSLSLEVVFQCSNEMSLKRSTQSQYLEAVQRLFKILDSNQDGEISWSEFLAFQARAKSALKAPWECDVHLIRREFRGMDSDGSGSISQQEFLDVMSKFYDVGGSSGTLEDVLDLIEASGPMGSKLESSTSLGHQEKEEFVGKMMADFDKADLDGDGTINFSEYIRKVWGEMETSDEMPPTLRQLRRQFKLQDLNGDGKISRAEFRVLAEKCYSPPTTSPSSTK